MNILFILDHQKASGGGHVQGLNYHRIFLEIFRNRPNTNLFFLDDKDLSGSALNTSNSKSVKVNKLKIRLKILDYLFRFFPILVAITIARKSSLSIEKKLKNLGIDLLFFSVVKTLTCSRGYKFHYFKLGFVSC